MYITKIIYIYTYIMDEHTENTKVGEEEIPKTTGTGTYRVLFTDIHVDRGHPVF